MFFVQLIEDFIIFIIYLSNFFLLLFIHFLFYL